jgi:hypothetical protein
VPLVSFIGMHATAMSVCAAELGHTLPSGKASGGGWGGVGGSGRGGHLPLTAATIARCVLDVEPREAARHLGQVADRVLAEVGGLHTSAADTFC